MEHYGFFSRESSLHSSDISQGRSGVKSQIRSKKLLFTCEICLWTSIISS